MNSQLLKIILTSPNPKETLLSMMKPEQREQAEEFLKNPNDEALSIIMKKYNVSHEQLDTLKNSINLFR